VHHGKLLAFCAALSCAGGSDDDDDDGGPASMAVSIDWTADGDPLFSWDGGAVHELSVAGCIDGCSGDPCTEWRLRGATWIIESVDEEPAAIHSPVTYGNAPEGAVREDGPFSLSLGKTYVVSVRVCDLQGEYETHPTEGYPYCVEAAASGCQAFGG
jgi:hypothetical protein